MSSPAEEAGAGVGVESVEARAFTVPTDEPESDGTFEWDSTTIVVVHARGGGETGLGYTYAHRAACDLIRDPLARVVRGRDVMDTASAWMAMQAAVRNIGRPGVAMMAISAVDLALWDLKARVLGVPLVEAVGAARDSVPIYGSGGFTSYSLERLHAQLEGWVEQGIPRVKMKVSRRPDEDPVRLDTARKAIGDAAELFVDANGALSRKRALDWAERFRHEWDVTWFEEPVTSDDLDGLRLIRGRAPAGMDIAAGEYGFVTADFHGLLEAGAVDVLQADVTRCGGVTGLLRIASMAAAHHLDISGHCAPAASVHALCAIPNVRHLEYFHDHVRLESLLFEGIVDPREGRMSPDRSRPGAGLRLNDRAAERHRVR